jgi:hypothetical protein
MPGFSYGEMAHRTLIQNGSSFGSFESSQPTRWGPPHGTTPVLFNPKLRCKATLHSRGDGANPNKGYQRADLRQFYLLRAARALSRSNATKSGTSGVGIPAAYQPISPANAYGGRTT